MDDLRRLDMNLLLCLHALLAERHVTRAALRLHKSQPAMSHGLAQLRDIFQDPLLVRRGGKMELTPRAQELQAPLELALVQLNALIQAPQFEPARSTRRFRLSLSDYAATLLLPALMAQLRQQAPGIDLAVTQASREAMLAQLMDGDVDLALGVFPDAPQEVQREILFTEQFVSVADPASLSGRRSLSLDEWLARPHVLVAMRSDIPNEIDLALHARGLQRRIALTLPHWSAATQVVPGTDLVLTVARRSLESVPAARRLSRFKPPLALPDFAFEMAWHQRRNADTALRWLRQCLGDCGRETKAVAERCMKQ